MAPIRTSFIGFGAVASTFARPMAVRGAMVTAYDLLLHEEGGRHALESRAQGADIRFCALAEALSHADLILSTVSTQAAGQVAAESAAYLRPGQIYVDLNSTAPSAKTKLAGVIHRSGASFVEGAILDAVGTRGAQAHILLAGERAKEVSDLLTELGLHATYYGPEIGKASMFKMLRSIFSKGVEAIILECLVAGRNAGIEQDLWKDIVGYMSSAPFDQIAANWVKTHAVAYERRYHEVGQVVETMREIGVEPIMTRATEAFFARSQELGFGEVFPDKPGSPDEVIDFMVDRLTGGHW